MKKKYLSSVILPLLFKVLILLTVNGFATKAEEMQIKVEGEMDFQSAWRYQEISNLAKEIPNQHAFYSEGNVRINVEKNNEASEMDYGLIAILNPSMNPSKSSSLNGSHIFIHNNKLGKLELGSPYDAGSKMRLTSDIIAKGSLKWDQYSILNPYKITAINFRTYPDFFFDSIMVSSLEPARKVSYYSPKLGGLQLGVSYIPDTENTGASNLHNTDIAWEESTLPNGTKIKYKNMATNSFAGGVSFEHQINDEADVKISLTGESGKGLVHSKDDVSNAIKEKKYDLFSYNLGGVVTYNNYSVAMSYGALDTTESDFPQKNKALDDKGMNTTYYTLGAAYSQGPVGGSITILHSKSGTNYLDVVSLGTDYKLNSGLIPYLEISYFRTIAVQSENINQPEKYEPQSGTNVMLGLKLQF